MGEVKERPILFSGPMVRAILEGRKTVTRRIVKGKFPDDEFIRSESGAGYGWWNQHPSKPLWLMTGAVGIARDAGFDTSIKCPYGVVGDRLWIKTGYSTRYDAGYNQTFWSIAGSFFTTYGKATSKSGKVKRDGCHSGRFMPNWLSQELRLPLLEITDIRVERLHEMTEEEAVREGFEGWYSPCHPDFGETDGRTPLEEFCELWDKLNKSRGFGFDSNPWVWRIEFRRV